MDSLLKHMVHMTGHRDHAMLDLSTITAVQELAGAAQTRILALARNGGPARVEDQPGAGRGEPLEQFAALAQCLAARGARAEQGDSAQATMWVPIWIGEQVASCLEIVRTGPFTPDVVHMIDGIVGVYRNFHNLLDYSERDSLTGLLNRKTFDDQLARVLQGTPEPPLPGQPERRQQQGAGLEQWLAVMDIDHFKLVNDRFGHLYGDEVLILIANMLQSSFRSDDRVFRFGGEEFVVLLRSTTAANAGRIIDRFRKAVEAHQFPQVGKVTVSIGFTSIKACESPVVTLGHADQALYYAKTHGRNQVCHYDQLVADGLLQAVAPTTTVELF